MLSGGMLGREIGRLSSLAPRSICLPFSPFLTQNCPIENLGRALPDFNVPCMRSVLGCGTDAFVSKGLDPRLLTVHRKPNVTAHNLADGAPASASTVQPKDLEASAAGLAKKVMALNKARQTLMGIPPWAQTLISKTPISGRHHNL